MKKEPAEPIQSPKKQSKTWNLGRIVWGLVFILVGLLFLLDNFDVIDVDTANIWRLWPLLIIASGISILSIRNTWSVVAVALLIILSLGVFAAGATGVISSNNNTDISETSLDIKRINKNIDQLSLNITANAGQLEIDSAPISDAVQARLESSFARLSHESVVQGATQKVTISTETINRQPQSWWRGNHFNKLSVTITEKLPLSIAIDSNASQVIADLSDTELEKLSLKSGASESKIKLGMEAKTTDVTIDTGMSSVTLILPKDAGISAQIKSGMSSSKLTGLREITDNYYESDNYDSAENKIDIQSDFGMASFKIEYY